MAFAFPRGMHLGCMFDFVRDCITKLARSVERMAGMNESDEFSMSQAAAADPVLDS